jgi:hypothetical protein
MKVQWQVNGFPFADQAVTGRNLLSHRKISLSISAIASKLRPISAQ